MEVVSSTVVFLVDYESDADCIRLMEKSTDAQPTPRDVSFIFVVIVFRSQGQAISAHGKHGADL